jgi:hypothetical protein
MVFQSVNKLMIPAAFLGCLMAVSATAEIITANCTGMLNFDIYKFDSEAPQQMVEGIGEANFELIEDSIILTGVFGEYRFNIEAGTLYHNGSDTGIYCTYTGL